MDELFQSAKKEKQKKKKINKEKRNIIIIGIILVILSLGMTIFRITYSKDNGSGKDIIISNLKNNNISEYTDLKDIEKMLDKQNNTPYEVTTDIHLNEDTKRNIENTEQGTINKNQDANKTFNNIKIGDLIFSSKSKIEPNKNIGQIQLDVKYKENNIFNFNFLDDGQTISIFEPSYFKEALGFDKKKIKDTNFLPKKQETLEEELEKEELIKNLEFNLSKDVKMNPAKEIIQIVNIYQSKYVEELSKLPKEKFKFKKNVPTKYRDKEVKADNITLEVTKEELEKITNTVKEETKKEISKNITDYSTFKFLSTTKKTVIGNILNSYVLPIENIGIEMFDTTNNEIQNENAKDVNNNKGNESTGLITLVDENGKVNNENTNTNINANSNRQNSNEVVGNTNISTNTNVINENDVSKENNNNNNNNDNNNGNNDNDNDNNNNNNINLDTNIIINFYIIEGKDIKIDKVENDVVTKTIEVYTDKNNKKTQEIIYGYVQNGRQIKYKISKTEDNGSIYNHIEMQDLVADKIINSVNAEFVRNQNIDASNYNITYKITKNFGNKIKGSNINKNIKFTDNIEVGTKNEIIKLNDLDQNAFSNLMINTIYSQITKVTSEKILQMENLLSVTKENQITGKETEPVTNQNIQNNQDTQNGQENLNNQNQSIKQNQNNNVNMNN